VRVGSQARIPPAIIGLKHMKEVATELLKDVLDAYAQRDEERAREVWERDVDLDELEDSVFRDLLTYMMEDPRNISFCAHLLFSSKNIERIFHRHGRQWRRERAHDQNANQQRADQRRRRRDLIVWRRRWRRRRGQ
jgi:phosphate uptake regulator